VHFAVARTNEDGSFAAKADMRKFANRGRESRGDSDIHGIATFVEEAHAGIDCVITAGGDGSMGSARCMANRTFHFALPLREDGERRREEQKWQSDLHVSGPDFILTGFGGRGTGSTVHDEQFERQ
jgi:hypothetical protein